MSLILEALKKLDREKQVPDRGVVIVGPSAWPSPREGLSAVRGAGLVLAALVVGGAAGALWLLRGPRTAETPVQGAAAAGPSQPAEAGAAWHTVPPAGGRAPVSGVMPAKPDAYGPVASVPARGAAARSKARPASAAAPDAAAEPPAEEDDAAQVEAVSPEPAPEEVAAAIPEEVPAAKPGRKSAAPDFQLQAISAQNGQPVAMLNDRLVREGDTFDNVKVVRIGADEIEIEVSGRRRIVKF